MGRLASSCTRAGVSAMRIWKPAAANIRSVRIASLRSMDLQAVRPKAMEHKSRMRAVRRKKRSGMGASKWLGVSRIGSDWFHGLSRGYWLRQLRARKFQVSVLGEVLALNRSEGGLLS